MLSADNITPSRLINAQDSDGNTALHLAQIRVSMPQFVDVTEATMEMLETKGANREIHNR